MEENKASTGVSEHMQKVWHRKKHARVTPMEENMLQKITRGLTNVKFLRANLKTCFELGRIGTNKTGTENALRGAIDVPAAARKRSKLRPAAAQHLGHSDTNRANVFLTIFRNSQKIEFLLILSIFCPEW